MTKKDDVQERGSQAGKMISVRIDPKTRYLAEVAAAAKRESLTKYLEWALQESFKLVSLHVSDESEPMVESRTGEWRLPEPPDPAGERAKREHLLISNQAESLWSESPYLRLQMRNMIAPLTVSEDERALLSFIHSREDLKISVKQGYKFDREKIDSEWESITAAFEKSKKGGK